MDEKMVVYRNSDFEILRYHVSGWDDLSLSMKRYIYELSEACLWGRDILYLQHHRLGLALRSVLEAIWEHGVYRTAELEDYLARVWMYSGVHHTYEERKVVPYFTAEYLEEALSSLPYNLDEYLAAQGTSREELVRLIMDPDYDPIRRASGDSETLVERSAVNFYGPGITTSEAREYYAQQVGKYEIAPGLNTRLVRGIDGTLTELDAYTDGLYGDALQMIVQHLTMAVNHAPSAQSADVLQALIAFYESGNINDFAHYSKLWVHLNEEIDMINGFIETYSDPLGLKGSYEGIVQIEDKAGTERARKVALLAAELEADSPIAQEYKREKIGAMSTRAIDVVMLAGDSYPASPLGINLPNDETIRAEVGSKSVTLSNISSAVSAARMKGIVEHFYLQPEVQERVRRYGTLVGNVHTDLHEGIGHGSGRLLPGITGDALREYDSAIEEARADLNALYFIAHPSVIHAGILPSIEAAYTLYDTYLTGALLIQLARVGDEPVLREAHLQNRALIANWVLDRDSQGRVVVMEEHDGQHYVVVRDYDELRKLFGELLMEIQRIKSTGDYDAAKHLIITYGTDVDPRLVAEVKERYAHTGAVPYIGFVNPVMTRTEAGDILLTYEENYIEQNLRYGKQYRTLALRLEDYPKLSDSSHSEGRWHELLTSVRVQLKRGMDGEVAKSMRDKGVDYGINFGVNLLRLREIGQSLPQCEELFNIMWPKRVREMKLLSLYTLPDEYVTVERCLVLVEECPTVEVSEQLVTLVLMRRPKVAEKVAKKLWKDSDKYPSAQVQLIPYIILARMAMGEKISIGILTRALAHAYDYLRADEPHETVVTYILRAFSRVAERHPKCRKDIGSMAKKIVKKTENRPQSLAYAVGRELQDLLHYLSQEI